MRKTFVGAWVGALVIAMTGLSTPALASPTVNSSEEAGIQSVTTATGSRTCGPQQQVYVRFTLDNYGTATVTKQGTGGTSVVLIGTDLFHVFGASTVSWKVTAANGNGIATINDGCVVAR